MIWKVLLCIKIFKIGKFIAYFKLYSLVDILTEIDGMKQTIPIESKDSQAPM